MPSYEKSTLIEMHELNIGLYYFHENFIVSEIKEGTILSFENASELMRLAKVYYTDKTPFVYIANRVNSYSFEPTGHFKSTKLFPNLRGYAVVSYDAISTKIAELEKAFLHVPTSIFTELDEAIAWTNELIVND